MVAKLRAEIERRSSKDAPPVLQALVDGRVHGRTKMIPNRPDCGRDF